MTDSSPARRRARFMSTALLPLALAALAPAPCSGQDHTARTAGWDPKPAPTDAEFRGLDSPSPDVVWAVGSGGVWAVTEDGGDRWRTGVIPGADSLFLVGVYAVDGRTTHVLATHFDGGLSRVYYTEDGGTTWEQTFEDRRPEAFYDGMAFWGPNRGVIFGDAIDGRMTIARTDDGRRWTFAEEVPVALEGEGGFAASGRAVAVAGEGHAWIGTGVANRARVLRSTDGGRSWEAVDTPLPAGPTSGVFGVAFRDTRHGVAVGGNYQDTISAALNVVRTDDGGGSWELVGRSAPTGVRYGAAWTHRPDGSGPVLVAVGPSGSGYSDDGGETWTAVGGVGYNTVVFRHGAGWAAGVDGRVARWRW